MDTENEPPGEIHQRLTVLEKNRVIDGLLLACLPLGLLGFLAFTLFRFSPGALGIHLAVIAAVIRFGIHRDNSRAKPVDRDIRISAEGVRIDGELLPRSAIAEGWYQPRSNGATMRLVDKQKRVIFEARVAREEIGRSLPERR